MEVELVEFVVLNDEREALSDISAPSVNLKAVIEEVLHIILVIQLVVSDVVPFQEFTD